MYDANYIGAWDLDGRDVTVEIEKVTAGELVSEGNKKSRKPIVSFKGKEKKLAINKTNGKAIANMYGPDTRKWIGKRLTIYPTTTKFGRDTVDCIRVRPAVPKAGTKVDDSPMPAVDTRPAEDEQRGREPGEEG